MSCSKQRRSKVGASFQSLAQEIGFVGESFQHRQLLETLWKVGPIDVEVLISGPSGVGKELYARFLHAASARSEMPFMAINCATLTEQLFENELFGHVAGAYTDARHASGGLIEATEGGTLFLDEVDACAPGSQAKLLRFVQEKEYRRLGETYLRHASIRIVAATNADLEARVDEGDFRKDLLFRLRVVPVDVPSLRERSEDVPSLVNEFTARYANEYDLPRIEIAPCAWQALLEYDWPGNVRELENCVRYLTCRQFDRPVTSSDLPLLGSSRETRICAPESSLDPLVHSFHDAKRSVVDTFERRYIEAALRRANGNIAKSAALSGKNRRAFFELMRKHGVQADTFRP